jgi:hypothetical protein
MMDQSSQDDTCSTICASISSAGDRETGTLTPPGYDYSVVLVSIGDAPVAQLFDIGPVRVPDSFHLKLGVAGGTTVHPATRL